MPGQASDPAIIPATNEGRKSGPHSGFELALEPRHDVVPLLRCQDLCMILDTPKGRGVFASSNIPSRTIIDVSPVLLFQPQEYADHGRFTQLSNYTYVWPAAPASSSAPPLQPDSADTTPGAQPSSAPSQAATDHDKRPRQALPLGLGSLFNHTSRSSRLNVGWTRNAAQGTITYTALRQIERGEELCISYGAGLWFEDAVDEGRSDEDDAEDESAPLERLDSGLF